MGAGLTGDAGAGSSGGSSTRAGPGGGGAGTGGSDTATLPGGLGGGGGLLAVLARVMPTVVVTTGAVTLAMAFLAFGKRRRDQVPTASDAVLGAAAARGTGLVANSGLVPAMAVATTAAVRTALAAAPAFEDVDAHLPRWRRPSLMEARKGDPLRSVSTAVHLTFDGEVGAAVTGLERRRIRYRMVSLLSDPDEVRGMEIGVLDEGDEVILLEKRGTYWRVPVPRWRRRLAAQDGPG